MRYFSQSIITNYATIEYDEKIQMDHKEYLDLIKIFHIIFVTNKINL